MKEGINKKMKKFRKKKELISKEQNNEDIFDEGNESPTKWYDQIAKDPKNIEKVSEQILIELKEEAKKCLDSEAASYNIKAPKTNPDYQWMKTVMVKGTVSDKLAAHTVTIQDNPVCNLETLRKLVGMVKVGKKKECMAIMETLTELFLEDLLRQNSTLKPFHNRPLSKLNDLSSGNAITRRKLLSTWYFEDQLKEVYTSFVLALNTVAHDTVDSNKEKAITAMHKLLAGNPEQEKNLLAHIVNKLGDPSQKVASKAIYCLGQLLYKNPSKQSVVLAEIEKLLFRSNVSQRAQYYGLCFLTQFYLSQKSNDIAKKLIDVYFAFFKACIKKGDVDTRMMSALLMGVNRAYPYAKLEKEKISEHIDTIYRIVHIASFNVSLHALSLLFQVSAHSDNISDRFYSALYKKLLDPRLVQTTHQAMVLSLVYKSLTKDMEVNRIKVFIKRLLQVALNCQPNLSCALLFLISQIMNKKEGLGALVFKQSSTSQFDDDGEAEEKYMDIKEENEELKTDVQENKIEESIIESKPDIISEDEDVKPDVKVLSSTLPATSWYHCNNTGKKFRPNNKYNPLGRNPLYAGGEHSTYTELLYLKDHAHPSVSLYATNLLSGEKIMYTGDPIKDFTVIRFLDRFAFKNPKKCDETQGAHTTFGKRKAYKPKGVRALPVNSNAYLNENQKNIPVDEMFMYMYIQKKYTNRKIKEEEDDSDLESVQSDEFEDMLYNMGTLKDVDDDLDYMNDIGDSLQNKKDKKKSKENEEGESEDDESDDEELDDEIEDMEDDELDDLEGDEVDEEDEDEDLIGDLEDDEEDMEFGSSDEDENLDQANKTKKSIKKLKKCKKDDINSLFASADEFATLLDDEGSSKLAPGTSNALANKDKASVKQLAWEEKRNRWLHGFNKAVGKGGKGKGKGKKRQNQANFSHKPSKKRKLK